VRGDLRNPVDSASQHKRSVAAIAEGLTTTWRATQPWREYMTPLACRATTIPAARVKLCFMLELQRLALLCAVAERGSISAAGEAMSYTPSAASQQLRRLEDGLGVRLVERGPRGASLTAAGEALLPHARAILGRASAAENEMHALAAAHGGHLRMSVFPTVGATVMPQAIAAFATRHPGVELTVIEDETANALAALDRREADLVIGYDFPQAPARRVEITRTELFNDPMHLAVPASHPLAASPRPRLRDLADAAWISSHPDQPCAQALATICSRAGFAPRIVYRSDDYTTIHTLVASHVGIAMIPTLAIEPDRADIVLLATNPGLPTRRVFAATTTYPASAVRAMLRILDEIMPALDLPGN
jgi:DNA-binding transcriptional LysR family regulator